MSDENILPNKRRNKVSDIGTAAKKLLENRKAKKDESNSEDVSDTKTVDATKQNAAHMREVSQQLDKLFSPKVFRGVVRGPADVMLATTGDKLWDLPADEVDAMAETGAMTARFFMDVEPKWVALTLFSLTILNTYGMRAGQHYAKSKREALTKMRVGNDVQK